MASVQYRCNSSVASEQQAVLNTGTYAENLAVTHRWNLGQMEEMD
jgi:hypothetical protein